MVSAIVVSQPIHAVAVSLSNMTFDHQEVESKYWEALSVCEVLVMEGTLTGHSLTGLIKQPYRKSLGT